MEGRANQAAAILFTGAVLGSAALVLFKPLRSRIFAAFWIFSGESSCDAVLREKKRELLSSSPPTGSCLDVGTGAGVQLSYIAHYPGVHRIMCVEPNAAFRPSLDRRIAEIKAARKGTNKPIDIEVFIGTIEEYFDQRGSNQEFDCVTCFLVLCTLPDPLVGIRLLHRALKPRGRFIFIEHVAPSPIGGIWHCLFRVMQPLFNVLGDGCQICRQTETTIRRAASWETVFSFLHFPPKSRVPVPWVFGIATKRNCENTDEHS